jgi:hypothetical protein
MLALLLLLTFHNKDAVGASIKQRNKPQDRGNGGKKRSHGGGGGGGGKKFKQR